MASRKTSVDKTSQNYMVSRVNNSRSSLSIVAVLTVVNLAMMLTQSNRYFLFSASVPYYLTRFAFLIDNFSIGSFTITALVISAVILGAYLLCFLMFGKQIGKGNGWLIAALVLFCLDSLGLLYVTFCLIESPASNLMDLFFHGWVIWSLAAGIHYNNKLIAVRQEALSSISRPQVEIE